MLILNIHFFDKFLKYNSEGQVVEVKFNVESKEHNGKYFTNVTAWSIRSDKGNATEPTSTAPSVAQAPIPATAEEKDDLPF